MNYRKARSGKAVSMPEGLLLGTVSCLLTTVLGAALLSKMVDMEKILWETVGYGVMVILFGSAFLGAKVALNSIKRQRFLVCLCLGGVYFATLMIVTGLFFGGQYQAVGETGLLVLGGSLSAALLRAGEKGRRMKHSSYGRCKVIQN